MIVQNKPGAINGHPQTTATNRPKPGSANQNRPTTQPQPQAASAPQPQTQTATEPKANDGHVLLFKLRELPRRLFDGVKRVLQMALLRPTGWLECAFLHPLTGGISFIALASKHFMEGLLHVDSLFMPRILPSPLGFLNGHNQYGRTLLGAIRHHTPEYAKREHKPGLLGQLFGMK